MAETRKLAAILAADVAGYSKLASADEERTLARLRALRSDLIDPTIAVHHGRLVKRTGDGGLIEFRSVVDAALQFRPVVAPASLNLGVLGNEDAADAREVAHYGGTLGLQAEARPALPIRAHPVIGNESCGFGLHLGLPFTSIRPITCDTEEDMSMLQRRDAVTLRC